MYQLEEFVSPFPAILYIMQLYSKVKYIVLYSHVYIVKLTLQDNTSIFLGITLQQ